MVQDRDSTRIESWPSLFVAFFLIIGLLMTTFSREGIRCHQNDRGGGSRDCHPKNVRRNSRFFPTACVDRTSTSTSSVGPDRAPSDSRDLSRDNIGGSIFLVPYGFPTKVIGAIYPQDTTDHRAPRAAIEVSSPSFDRDTSAPRFLLPRPVFFVSGWKGRDVRVRVRGR